MNKLPKFIPAFVIGWLILLLWRMDWNIRNGHDILNKQWCK